MNMKSAKRFYRNAVKAGVEVRPFRSWVKVRFPSWNKNSVITGKLLKLTYKD